MTKVIHKTSAIGGITLHTIPTKKYKTNAVIFKMKAPLQEESAALRALLPYVLQSGSTAYPSYAKIRSKLDELYGATLSVDLAKKGENHIISFRMDVANGSYLSENLPLLHETLQLLSELLFAPLLDNGQTFRSEIVAKEKRTLKQRLQSMLDDKMKYSSMRLVEEMCEHEPYRINPYGDLAKIDAITAEELTDYYKAALAEDKLDLYIVGDVDHAKLEALVSEHFKTEARKAELVRNDSEAPLHEEQEVFEEQEIKQGKLNIGYRTNITFTDDDYFALQVFNGIFGGFSHSKLFINVREKASLAYFASSRLESHKGLLLVMSGIEFNKYDQAVTIIKEQMDMMKKGDFTDEEIAQTKAVIMNQLLQSSDNANGLVEILYHEEVSGMKRAFEDWLTGIEAVTRSDIIRVAEKIKLDTVYFLKGLEGTE